MKYLLLALTLLLISPAQAQFSLALNAETQGTYTHTFAPEATLLYAESTVGISMSFSVQKGPVHANSGAYKDYPIEGQDYDATFYRFGFAAGPSIALGDLTISPRLGVDSYSYARPGETPFAEGLLLYPDIFMTYIERRLGFSVGVSLLRGSPRYAHFSGGLALKFP